MKDFYKILGVDEKATADEIKRAYKKLAVIHHPDKGGDGETIKAINEAYDTLKSAGKKNDYDMQRANPFAHQQSRRSPFNSGFDINLDDLFSAHFNFDTKSPDTYYFHEITLETAFHGKKDVARLENGDMLDLNIPSGIEDGAQFRFKGMSNKKQFQDQQPGDVVIKIKIRPDPNFLRNQTTLFKRLDISALDCILGIDKVIVTIDRKKVIITIPAGTQSGTKFRVPGYGMPLLKTKNRGDLIIEANVTIPNITDKDKLDMLRKINGNN